MYRKVRGPRALSFIANIISAWLQALAGCRILCQYMMPGIARHSETREVPKWKRPGGRRHCPGPRCTQVHYWCLRPHWGCRIVDALPYTKALFARVENTMYLRLSVSPIVSKLEQSFQTPVKLRPISSELFAQRPVSRGS